MRAGKILPRNFGSYWNDYEFTYSKVRTETRELLGGTEETNILPEKGVLWKCQKLSYLLAFFGGKSVWQKKVWGFFGHIFKKNLDFSQIVRIFSFQKFRKVEFQGFFGGLQKACIVTCPSGKKTACLQSFLIAIASPHMIKCAEHNTGDN